MGDCTAAAISPFLSNLARKTLQNLASLFDIRFFFATFYKTYINISYFFFWQPDKEITIHLKSRPSGFMKKIFTLHCEEGRPAGKKQCKPKDKGLMASRWPWWSTTVMTTTAANLFILDPPSDTERANKAGPCATYLARLLQYFIAGHLDSLTRS